MKCNSRIVSVIFFITFLNLLACSPSPSGRGEELEQSAKASAPQHTVDILERDMLKMKKELSVAEKEQKGALVKKRARALMSTGGGQKKNLPKAKPQKKRRPPRFKYSANVFEVKQNLSQQQPKLTAPIIIDKRYPRKSEGNQNFQLIKSYRKQKYESLKRQYSLLVELDKRFPQFVQNAKLKDWRESLEAIDKTFSEGSRKGLFEVAAMANTANYVFDFSEVDAHSILDQAIAQADHQLDLLVEESGEIHRLSQRFPKLVDTKTYQVYEKNLDREMAGIIRLRCNIQFWLNKHRALLVAIETGLEQIRRENPGLA